MKSAPVFAIGFLLLSLPSRAQDNPQKDSGIVVSPRTPPVSRCDSYTMANLPRLGFNQKACYWRAQLFTGSAFFGASFFSGIAMAEHSPSEWPEGAKGFGYQFGTRYAQGMLKSTVTFGVGYLMHEDPRPKAPYDIRCGDHQHPPHSNVWTRLGASVTRVVWTHRDDSCTDTIAFSRIAGSLASGFIQRAYLPPSRNTVGVAFEGTGSALGGYVANSVWTEFQGDLFGWLGRRIATGKPKP